jgi:type II secretory pathway component PulF
MKFTYRAIRPDGKVTEGELEAPAMNEALAQVAAMGLRPILLKPIRKLSIAIDRLKGQKVTLEDKVFIMRYLSLMLKVGTDLFKAIDILIEDFDKPAVKSLLIEMRSNLEKGQPFYATFAQHPRLFSPVFVNLIKAGEVSGNLEKVFEQLSVSLEKDRDLQSKIKSALTYPVILFFASLIVLILLVSFSLPKIAGVFLTGGIKPPVFSAIVFTVGLFIGDHLAVVLTSLLVIFGGGFFFFVKTLVGKRIGYDIALHIPVIKTVIRETTIQRFASTFSSLLTSGIPIVNALEITSDSISMPELKDALKRIAREGISKGMTVGEAFRREPVFPKTVSNLIAVSEKSGHLESILATLAEFYTGEIETAVKSLVSFIEPVMLVMIGVIVGTIALAVIIPVYQLTASF